MLREDFAPGQCENNSWIRSDSAPLYRTTHNESGDPWVVVVLRGGERGGSSLVGAVFSPVGLLGVQPGPFGEGSAFRALLALQDLRTAVPTVVKSPKIVVNEKLVHAGLLL